MNNSDDEWIFLLLIAMIIISALVRLADLDLFVQTILIVLTFYIFIIVFFIHSIPKKKGNKKTNHTDKMSIEFDEFDDIEKIKHQNINDKTESKDEYDKMTKVYNLNGYIKAHEYFNSYYKNKVGKAYEKEILDGPCIIKLKNNGYDFDFDLFKKWSTQIFKCIKLRTEDQLGAVKDFMSEILYDKLINPIQMFKKDGLKFITENLIIETCNLYDYEKNGSTEIIKILIVSSAREYIIEANSKKIIRGTNKRSFRKKIIMTFIKKNTNDSEGLIHNCPNCGAKISQTEFDKCTYCNTLLVPIRYNWTLTKFETIY